MTSNFVINSRCKSYFKICLFAVFLSCYPVTISAETAPGTIISFGDSLTEGCDVYSGQCGWERSSSMGYQLELESLLQNSHRNYEVQNFGRGGETARDGLKRIDSVIVELCNARAEYILLLEGTNDLLHGARGEDVKFYLSIMIDKSRAHGLVPLLATLPPDTEPDHRYKDIPLMNEYIRDLASEKGVTLVDLYNKMNPYWDSFTPGCYGDNLHPNAGGFKAIGGIWFESLADMISPKFFLYSWLDLLLKKN